MVFTSGLVDDAVSCLQRWCEYGWCPSLGGCWCGKCWCCGWGMVDTLLSFEASGRHWSLLLRGWWLVVVGGFEGVCPVLVDTGECGGVAS